MTRNEKKIAHRSRKLKENCAEQVEELYKCGRFGRCSVPCVTRSLLRLAQISWFADQGRKQDDSHTTRWDANPAVRMTHVTWAEKLDHVWPSPSWVHEESSHDPPCLKRSSPQFSIVGRGILAIVCPINPSGHGSQSSAASVCWGLRPTPMTPYRLQAAKSTVAVRCCYTPGQEVPYGLEYSLVSRVARRTVDVESTRIGVDWEVTCAECPSAGGAVGIGSAIHVAASSQLKMLSADSPADQDFQTEAAGLAHTKNVGWAEEAWSDKPGSTLQACEADRKGWSVGVV
jgi:hypothetical protein